MKKIIVWTLLVATFLCLNGGDALAQTAQRIRFAKGSSSATVKGRTGGYGVAYVVRARGGQKLALNLAPARGVGIKVTSADGTEVLLREEHGGFFEIGLEESGDVTIFLGSTAGREAAFTLTVKITNMTDI